MKNLKRNGLVVPKLTLGIWWILIRALESLKNYTLMGCFWPKYIVFQLKKDIGAISYDTRWKTWRKTDSWFRKWHEEFGKFSPEHLKAWQLGLLWGPFIQSRKCMSLKFTGELCVTTIKNDRKFEKELTCQFKTDIRNLTSFDLGTQESHKFSL